MRGLFGVSERRACRAIGQPRSTQRYDAKIADDEPRLKAAILELASRYVRYGYRRMLPFLFLAGWVVNHKRVERIWRQEGLRVPKKQQKRRRIWLNDGSCVRLRPERKDHVWSYDFVADRTSDGLPLRFLTVIDEFTHESLAIVVGRNLTSEDVQHTLWKLFKSRGTPEYIRSDNGSEFTAASTREFLTVTGVKTLFIEPGSPWENGYGESFNGKFRDEFLNCELLDTVYEAKVLTGDWRWGYNHVRPHSSIGYKPPVPLAVLPSGYTTHPRSRFVS